MSSNVTLKEIAEALGVSAMTVSRALNNHTNVDEKTRRRILDMSTKMGYTPNHVAKSLVSRKTNTIGVVIPEISHVFFAQVVSGIESVTYKTDYQLILTNSAEDYEREKKAIQTLRSKRIDGLLVSSAETTVDYKHYEEVINSGIPIVFFDRWTNMDFVSNVSVDDMEGARNITLHMIDHGYDRIACFHGPDISIGKERLEGFMHAMRERDVSIDEKLIVKSGFLEAGGYRAMDQILSMPKEQWPRAIITVNDPVAIGALERIEEAGLSVPDDIAIAGFSDDLRAGLLKCPLTTVRQPSVEIGVEAAKKLIKILQNPEEKPEHIQLKTELIIRKSCGCN